MATRFGWLMGLAALVVAGAALAEDGSFPVRLNPDLGLASVDPAEIEARLRWPLWPDRPDDPGLKLYKFRGNPWVVFKKSFSEMVIDQQFAPNCAAMIWLTNLGYLAGSQNDREIQKLIFTECEAIEFLHTARPSRVSFVRDFIMSVEAPDVLPVMISNGGSSLDFCSEIAANERRVPWSAVDPFMDVGAPVIYRMGVQAEYGELVDGAQVRMGIGAETYLEILAWADFNGDGVEDVLIRSHTVAMEWSEPDRREWYARFGANDYYVVTRHSPGSALYVVDPERHLATAKRKGISCPDP